MSASVVEERAAPISRVTTLSLPKTLHGDFLEDKRSVYWDNGLTKDWAAGSCQATSFKGTQRVMDLARHKDLSRYKVNPDRPSAVSEVSKGAQNTTPTPRLEALAQPKQPPRSYEPARQAQSIVSAAAQGAEASAWIAALARPKVPHESALKDGTQYEWSEWQSSVTEAAKKATATDRVEALAVAKQPPTVYAPAKSPFWHANPDVKSYVATERLASLSQPRTHRSIHEEDRSVWSVKTATLHAQPSERVVELAAPLPRKQRSKK